MVFSSVHQHAYTHITCVSVCHPGSVFFRSGVCVYEASGNNDGVTSPLTCSIWIVHSHPEKWLALKLACTLIWKSDPVGTLVTGVDKWNKGWNGAWSKRAGKREKRNHRPCLCSFRFEGTKWDEEIAPVVEREYNQSPIKAKVHLKIFFLCYFCYFWS